MQDVNRKELKYLIGTDEVAALLHRMEQIMVADPHNHEGGYRVRSLYFDTISDGDYYAKVDGFDHRKKVRLRTYDGSSEVIKLEVKAKDGDFQRKQSLSLTRDEAEQMLREDYYFLLERKEPFAQALYMKLVTQGYVPKCIVEYDRLAFMSDYNEIRVTFDMNLRALEDPEEFFAERTELPYTADRSETTLELKYNGFLFSYIKQSLDIANRPRISNSKYVKARAMLK